MNEIATLKDYCHRADLVDSSHVLKVIEKYKSITELVKEAHITAVDKGWWEKPRSTIECIALMHCELSEAVEAYRNGNEENLVEELADTLIRIFDLCGARGWNLEGSVNRKMAFNKDRAYRHGGKLA